MSNCNISPPYYGLPASSPCTILNIPVSDVSGYPVSPFAYGPTPEASFFNIQGIYKQRFVPPYQGTFNSLYAYIQSVDPCGNQPDPFNNLTNQIVVKHMSQSQQRNYTNQIQIFQRVYEYNYRAYLFGQSNNTPPIYYKFATSSELTQFNAALALILKLYNVNALFPVQCLFWIPFPPFGC